MTHKNAKYPIFLTLLSSALLLTIVFFAIRSLQINQQLITLQKTPVTNTPTATPTVPANWQIFQNSTYQFSFKYPLNWHEVENFTKYSNLFAFEAPDKSQIQIIVDKTTTSTLNAYLKNLDQKNNTAWEGKPSKKIISTQILTLGNNAAVQRHEEWLAAGFVTLSSYIKHNDTIYIFNLLPGDQSYDKTQTFTYYNQIITSLNFQK